MEIFIEYLVQELGPLDIKDCVTVAYALNFLLHNFLSRSLKDILSSADKVNSVVVVQWCHTSWQLTRNKDLNHHHPECRIHSFCSQALTMRLYLI